MLQIHKKWLILATILFLITANSIVYLNLLRDYSIVILLTIPSLLWLDEALSKYKPNLSQLLSLLILLIIGWLFLSTGFKDFKNNNILLSLPSVKISFVIIHMLVLISALSYIFFQEFSPKFTIPHAYNIVIYTVFMLYLLVAKRGDYPFFIDILLNFIILNAIFIALYYIFNFHLTNHYTLTIPFYMIFLGILFTFYVYLFSPYAGGDLGRAKLNHDILRYICVQLFIIIGLLAIGINYQPITNSQNSYKALALLCIFTFLITCITRYITRANISTAEDELFSIFGIEILCFLTIFLFKVLEINNKLLTSLLAILVIIINSIKTMGAVISLTNKYNVLNISNKWCSDFFLSNYFISKHILFLLSSLLIISMIYKIIYPIEKDLKID